MSEGALADACALVVWFAGGGERMSAAGRAAMRGTALVSPITVWELTRKAALGALPPLPTVEGSFAAWLGAQGFGLRALGGADAERANALPPRHKDPMDRMLIAQALNAGLPVITEDRLFAGSGVTVICRFGAWRGGKRRISRREGDGRDGHKNCSARRATGWAGYKAMKFLVVGTGRCGTTFIRNVLNAHPDCFVCSESYWHMALWAKYGDEPAPTDQLLADVMSVKFHDGRSTLAANLTLLGAEMGVFLESVARRVASKTADVRSVCQAIEAAFLSVSGKTVFADKTPHYGYHLPALRVLWPELKIAHIIRDGRPCAASMSKHGGYQLLAALGVDDWTQIATIAAHLRPMPVIDDASRYLDMWTRQVTRISVAGRALPDGVYREFRYEHLLEDPHGFLAELIAFAGLRMDATWLNNAAAEVSRPVGYREGLLF